MKHACERISQLASQQLERKLNLSERVSMFVHFLMCGACKQYNQNILKLRQVFELKRDEMVNDVKLPELKRNDIQKVIRSHLEQQD
ncbi:MAG TPA: hypothetical protein EYP39_05085 [Ghiorsea sp.]|nr:hypothetical protein [Ghiorsea sp.]HIP07783.1 hypothetical protein [Mariprofundaceae bacterium]